PLGTLPRVNIGGVDNKGFETELTYRKQINQDWSFLLRGNFAYNKNTVVYADEVRLGDDYVYPFRSTGFSIGQQFGYQIDYSNGNGYINTPEELAALPTYEMGGTPRLGDFMYVDTNNDGLINDRDLVPIGYPSIPRVTCGLAGSVTHKNFDASFLFTGVGQSHQYRI